MSEASRSIPVDVRRFPWIRRLAADYAHDFSRVAPFFAGDPTDRHAWADAIARTQVHPRRRPEIATLVAAQQRRRRAPDHAVEAATRLADAPTVAVLTGQQAGLFGGPLFTLLKALTALKLAEQVSRDHDVPVVAIFWVEGEDHDWEKIRSATVFDRALEARTVALRSQLATEAVPVSSIRLDESIRDVIDELEQILPPTEFTSSLVAGLRAAYAPGAGMADAFATWLEQVLGDRGLVVYDASDPASKRLVSDVFVREISMPGHTGRLAALAGSDLVARGYHEQVHPQEDSLALFSLDGLDGASQARRAIRPQDGRFIVGDKTYPPAALLREASDRPIGFSPGVLLRPVAQDTLFPTVCYVAGPNELAYLGQLRGVYAHFGVPMPLMYPRASATLVDSVSSRFISKYQVPLEALQAQDEAALNLLLKKQIPPAVEESDRKSVV